MGTTQLMAVWAALSVPIVIFFVGLTLSSRKRIRAGEKEIEKLRLLAYRDELTGLLTRRTFEEEVEPHLREVVAVRDPAVEPRESSTRGVSLAVIDVDRFKKINDTLGHQAGDHVLRELAKLLKKHVRATDFSARWGGEEFAVAFVDVGMKGALRFAEMLRKKVEGAAFTWDGKALRITISVGVASFGNGMQNLGDLFGEADAELYKAKHGGRNRVSGQMEHLRAMK